MDITRDECHVAYTSERENRREKSRHNYLDNEIEFECVSFALIDGLNCDEVYGFIFLRGDGTGKGQ